MGEMAHAADPLARLIMPPRETAHVVVRWWDGYLEHFEATEVRFGSDLLWMRLSLGENRHIPLRAVRWFSTSPESHTTSGIV